MLSASEIQYLKSQHLARMATASAKGEPEVSPVAFEYGGKYFYVGSHDQSKFLLELEGTRTSRTGTQESPQ